MRTHPRTRCHMVVSIAAFLLLPQLVVEIASFPIVPTRWCSTRIQPLSSTKKDWDHLVDEEDDGPPVALDMRYVQRNVMRQNRNFVAISEAGGKDTINDLYAREPKSETFWFVGKVAQVSDVSVEQSVARQWNIIETHACNLRPIDLLPARRVLEVWAAPGNSEVEVAYNRPEIVFRRMQRDVSGVDKIKNSLIGFQGEVYEPGEEGFRTWRNDDGTPARPEVSGGPSSDDEEQTRAPTDEEMEEIQRALEGKDINAIYAEQQRREGMV